MLKPIVRLLAFFGKEINEVRRQPRLVLSLVLGPFLILLLFGIGYRGTPPPLRIALVVPPEEMDDPRVGRIQQIIEDNFTLVSTGSSELEAVTLLANGEVDVVEIIPGGLEERVRSGEQVPIAFRYNEVNPLDEQWLQYTGYAQVNALNQAILMQSVDEVQSDAAEASVLLRQTRQQLDALSSDAPPEQREATRASIVELDAVLALLAANPALAAQTFGESQTPDEAQQEVDALRGDLAAMDQALAADTLDDQPELLQSTRDRIARLEEAAQTFAEVPAQVLVQPLQLQYENLRGEALNLMAFYAPGVLALIIQHIAVTLGALSLVRERMIGALELFSIAPTTMLQVLAGKILAYTTFIGIIAALLISLIVFGLRVPFYGSVGTFALMLLLFVLSSVGVGLFVSTLSNSDTQAIQLSMLVLLVSIFFSGFFLPLEQFYPAARYAIPVTHAMSGFQQIMLLGRGASLVHWSWLAGISAILLLLVMVSWRGQFARVR